MKTDLHKTDDLHRSVEGFLEYCLSERGLSRLTVRDYRLYLGRFADWYVQTCGNTLVERVDLPSVRKFRLYLGTLGHDEGRPLSRLTQNYHMIALRAFLRWLVKNDRVVLSPEKIDLAKTESRSLKFLSTEDMERLLSGPHVSLPVGLRDRAILEVLFSTGLRVSELVKLDIERVDLVRGEFGVVGKGGRPRVVFLSQRAIEWVGRYVVTREEQKGPLFVHFRGRETQGSRLSARSVQRIVEKYVTMARLAIKITPHGIRHTFATDLLRAGADIRSVQEMLGHKNISTTQIYTHVTNKHLREVHTQFHGRGK